MCRRKRGAADAQSDEGSRTPGRRVDLQVAPFPVTTPDDWRDPEAALQKLYKHSEERAVQVSGWYLSDKRIKRTASQLLRALAVILGTLGGLTPLIQLLTPNQNAVSWGYVFLLLAAALVAFDKFFGLSAAWMRDISASQQVSRFLVSFQFRWSQLSLEAKIDEQASIRKRLQLLMQFNQQIDNVVELETSAWEAEFGASVTQLHKERSAAIYTAQPNDSK
jgi:hypothetical protein